MLLPQPDSPTRPSVSPRRIVKRDAVDRPDVADVALSRMPCVIGKYILRSLDLERAASVGDRPLRGAASGVRGAAHPASCRSCRRSLPASRRHEAVAAAGSVAAGSAWPGFSSAARSHVDPAGRPGDFAARPGSSGGFVGPAALDAPGAARRERAADRACRSGPAGRPRSGCSGSPRQLRPGAGSSAAGPTVYGWRGSREQSAVGRRLDDVARVHDVDRARSSRPPRRGRG